MWQEVGLPLEFQEGLRESSTGVQRGPPVSFYNLHYREDPLDTAIRER